MKYKKTYVIFKNDDPYELPIQYCDSISDAARYIGVSKSGLSTKLKDSNVVRFNKLNYAVEVFNEECVE